MKKETSIIKKIVFFVIALNLISMNSYSQNKYYSYKDGMFMKSLNLEVEKKNDECLVYLNMTSMDSYYSEACGILIREEKLNDLYNNMVFVKNKYIEWTQVAKENNITELIKPIEIPNQTLVNGFFTTSSMKIDKYTFPSFNFMVSKDSNNNINYFLGIGITELEDSENSYTTFDGAMLAFDSTVEFGKLVDKLKPESIKEFAKDLTDVESLFK